MATRCRYLTGVLILALSSLWSIAGSSVSSAAAAPAGEITEAADAVRGQYIVTLSAVSGAEVAPTAESLVAAHDGRILFTYRHALRGFAVAMGEADALALSQEPGVARVEENGLVHATATQTDPPWGLDRIDQGDLTGSSSYTYANRGARVRAYVLDTGIRSTHTQFGGRVSGGYTAIRDGRGTRDCDGHGTHVAGTIGGSTYGVAKGVRLVPVRVLDCQGNGTFARIMAGVDWVTGNAVRPAVANMSLGGFGTSPTLEAAIARSIRRGIVYVVAAGNDGEDACGYTPARVPRAITVGASDDRDAAAGFSNHGPCVDLFAPGVDIVSAGFRNNRGTRTLNGTSMAAPHVTGVVARYLQANPTASAATASSAVLSNSLAGRLGGLVGESPNRLLYSRFLEGVVAPLHPANDPFAGAAPLTGAVGQIVAGNRTATSEADEPLPDADDARATVWYRWTAPSSGNTLVNTCDAGFDAVLAIYQGTSLAELSPVTATGNIYCHVGDRSSGIAFSAVGGQDYYIAVDGTTADPTGWFQLRWQPS